MIGLIKRQRDFNIMNDVMFYTVFMKNIFQISVQCKENPEGRDGFVIYGMEAFPIVNFLFHSGAKDHAKDEE